MALILTGSSGSTTLDSSAGLTFSDSSNQQYAASPYVLKNRILNGAMAIDQRNAGSAQTITAGAALAYTVDRWYGYSTGANATGQRVAGSVPNQYQYQFTGASSVTGIGFGQRIESYNSYDLAGKTVTVSLNLANSLLTTVSWAASYANTTDSFGTLATATTTAIASGNITVTSTLTNYNFQISIPSAATTGIQIVFTVGAQTSGTWTIGNVQLEIGSTATPFERRLYNQELANCQRYYYRQQANNSASMFGTGFVNTTTSAVVFINFPVQMRSPPTSLEQSGTAANYQIYFSGPSNITCNSVPTVNTADIWGSTNIFFVASGLTAGQSCIARAASSSAYLGWSAEL